MALWTAGESVTATKMNDRMTADNSNLSHARYVQTTTQRSNSTNWPTDSGFWFNTARSTTSLITHSTAGTPLVSTFTINKSGSWTISTSARANGTTCNVYICKNGLGDANILAGSGVAIGPAISLTVALVATDTIQMRFIPLAATPVFNTLGDINFISFQFHGQPA
jgi:hypothetical protein